MTPRAINPGQSLQLLHPSLPVDGNHIVLGRDRDIGAGETAVQLDVPVGQAPVVRLVQQSTAHDPLQYAGATVATAGSDRTITLIDVDGRPIAGARVTVRELGVSGQTDAAGRLVIAAALLPAGAWTLDVLAVDGSTLVVEIIIQ
ncbi:MAG TPA: hypothetical protein VMR06_16270 [Dokdonella sp.]|uniref:hypothetical protein n=1 Tax=Dokdonella sp. TaxID=2291710 RepID=UPI002BC1D840|nr:hypothetical protein [Dokdonella sp.]HUD43545.1 hypothetical protein [Dokdonella sp.]